MAKSEIPAVRSHTDDRSVAVDMEATAPTSTLTVELAEAGLAAAREDYDGVMRRLVEGESVSASEMATAVDSIRLGEMRLEVARDLDVRREAAAAADRARDTEDAFRSPEWASRLRAILNAYSEVRAALDKLYGLADGYRADMDSACLAWRTARPTGTDQWGRTQYAEPVEVDGIVFGAPEVGEAGRLIMQAVSETFASYGVNAPKPAHHGAPAPVDMYRLALARLAGDDVDNE